MMHTNKEIRYKWRSAVDWLHTELERRPYGGSYSSWSPHASSNESSNGFFLERSPSAKLTLNKAIDLCPDDPGDADQRAIEQREREQRELEQREEPREIEPQEMETREIENGDREQQDGDPPSYNTDQQVKLSLQLLGHELCK